MAAEPPPWLASPYSIICSGASGDAVEPPPQAAGVETAVVARLAASRMRRFRREMVISSEDCASMTRPTLHRERRRSVEQRQVTYMVRTKAPLCQALSDCRSRRGRLVVATLPRRDRPIDPETFEAPERG